MLHQPMLKQVLTGQRFCPSMQHKLRNSAAVKNLLWLTEAFPLSITSLNTFRLVWEIYFHRLTPFQGQTGSSTPGVCNLRPQGHIWLLDGASSKKKTNKKWSDKWNFIQTVEAEYSLLLKAPATQATMLQSCTKTFTQSLLCHRIPIWGQ